MSTYVFRGAGMLRVFAAWSDQRQTFTAYAKDIHDTIVWQIGQQHGELPTIHDLRYALEPYRAFLPVVVVAALLNDQEGGHAPLTSDSAGALLEVAAC